MRLDWLKIVGLTAALVFVMAFVASVVLTREFASRGAKAPTPQQPVWLKDAAHGVRYISEDESRVLRTLEFGQIGAFGVAVCFDLWRRRMQARQR